MIESAWEDEASTTVEQGEVAAKIRELGLGLEPKRGNTSVTSSGVSDEPTVDDQRASAALALLPPPLIARLVITQGNDLGQALEIRAGKTYTIGRGVDNDLVLSDISVSRKHFDLRNDNGAWVLADRGSGNGTVINNQLEDAAFTLASGDVIEIGNTAFRFDVPNGVPRAQLTYESTGDHLASAAAKTVRDADVPVAGSGRPKTLPPPAPLPRPHSPTNRPLAGYALDRPATQPPPGLTAALAHTLAPQALPPTPQPSTTMPLPQMANRPPLAPGALLDLPSLHNAPSGSRPPHSPPGATTLPGQGRPGPAGHPARLPFVYQSRSSTRSEPPATQPPGGLRRNMHVAPTRDGTSTALVNPISYPNQAPAVQPQAFKAAVAPLSPRMKLAVLGGSVVVFLLLATIAIVKGSGNDDAPADPPAPPTATSPAVETRPIVEPIHEPAPAEPLPPTPPMPSTTADRAATPSLPPAIDKPAPDRPAIDKPAPDRPAIDRPAIDRPTSVETTRLDTRKPPRRLDKKLAPPRIEVDKHDDPASKPDRKHPTRTTQDVKSEANAQYRAKNFNGAAAAVSSALPLFTGTDAADLRTIGAIYNQLGKTYNVGMAPGTKPTDAYVALLRARSYDHDLGSVYVTEIDQRLISVASHAAASFAASKDYELAFQAVRLADSLGSTSPTNKLVRDKLEEVAGDLVRAAQSELASDPEGARRKLHQVLGMVEPKHALYGKASKLLNGQ